MPKAQAFSKWCVSLLVVGITYKLSGPPTDGKDIFVAYAGNEGQDQTAHAQSDLGLCCPLIALKAISLSD